MVAEAATRAITKLVRMSICRIFVVFALKNLIFLTELLAILERTYQYRRLVGGLEPSV
jgi:hypothetical protein